MIEEMATLGIGINRHVLLLARERTATGNCLKELTKLGRVKCIADFQEIGEKGDLGWGKVTK